MSLAAEAAADYFSPPAYDPEWFRSNPNDNIPGRARAKQRPPDPHEYIWLLMAGRGFGKSRTGAGWIDWVARTRCLPGEQVLIAGRTPADVRDYALKGAGGLLTQYPDILYEPSKRLLTWPNGVTALIRSGANPEEFRGFSGQYAWIEELAAWTYPDECWANLMLGMRERSPKITITSTPKPIKLIREIIDMPNTHVTMGSSYENAPNLSEAWVTNVLDPLKGTRRGRQEVFAEFLEDAEGALWSMFMDEDTKIPGIDNTRIQPDKLPDLVRIVIGVDPQGSKTDGAMTGIVVSGLAENGHGYVLEDASINGAPSEWGKRVVRMYEKYDADRVVVERNFGGEMVEQTIRTIDSSLPITMVHASRGKLIRAEPVAALYEQFKVHHVGILIDLEDEMIFYEGTGKSPNRLDAMVWSITALMLAKKRMRGGTWGTPGMFRRGT